MPSRRLGARHAAGPGLIRDSTQNLLATATLAGAVVLGGCDVRVADLTPAELPQTTIGIYPIRARVVPGVLVNPNSVYLFAHVGAQRLALAADANGEWSALEDVHCAGSFPLQLEVVWKVELIARSHLVPESPRVVRLRPLPPGRETLVNTGPQAAMPHGGWPGSLALRFGMAPRTQLRSVRLEPLDADPAAAASAAAITLVDPLPLTARCGEPLELRFRAARADAAARVAIETDDPALPRTSIPLRFLVPGEAPARTP